jgi:hypothetical protein
MRGFLSIATQVGCCADSDVDKAWGTMGKNSEGKVAVTWVTLLPAVRFSGQPSPTRWITSP